MLMLLYTICINEIKMCIDYTHSVYVNIYICLYTDLRSSFAYYLRFKCIITTILGVNNFAISV